MKNKQNARKHGHYPLEKSLKRDGFSVLTRRQRETVAEWRQNVQQDAGGRDQLSQLKQFQLERLLVTEVLIQSIDAYLLSQPSIINKRKKTVIPILEQRSRLAETSLKLSAAIGLDRKLAPVCEACRNCGRDSVNYACMACGKHVLICDCEPLQRDSVSETGESLSRDSNRIDEA